MIKRTQSTYRKKLQGTTMPELLVVMIVSGIVFLLLFDGLSIVQRYGRMVDRKLSERSGLLYSHQALEALLEMSDSIGSNEGRLFLHIRGNTTIEQLEVDSGCLLHHKAGYTDTLFSGMVAFDSHPAIENPSLIDSLFLFMKIGRDTIRLDYGIFSGKEQMLTEYTPYDTEQW